MKKLMIFLCLLMMPLKVFAYSNEVILGGQTIGIDIKTKGIMVIGFYKVDNTYPTRDIKEGDMIIKVKNTDVTTTKELMDAIEENMVDNKVEITYLRGDKEYQTTLNLFESQGVYKTGLYVKDSITGIGTLTFIDPQSDIYGALGHEIAESNTSKIVEVEEGTIFENTITGIEASQDGKPGSKSAKFYYQNTYGDITKNTKYGIYGNYKIEMDDTNLIEIANPEEIKIGKAKIYTVLDGNNIEEFEIYIENINENSEVKNLTFEITDEKLLNKTGGIVQGMSGSPIVQDNKLIGAVTHVITDDVTRGYGIFITTMLKESEQ